MQGRYKYRIKWFKLLVIALSGYFIYLCVVQQSQLNAISHEAEATRIQIEQLQKVNANLNEERNALKDRRYVEKLAREELGLVKPGEMPYITADKNKL